MVQTSLICFGVIVFVVELVQVRSIVVICACRITFFSKYRSTLLRNCNSNLSIGAAIIMWCWSSDNDVVTHCILSTTTTFSSCIQHLLHVYAYIYHEHMSWINVNSLSHKSHLSFLISNIPAIKKHRHYRHQDGIYVETLSCCNGSRNDTRVSHHSIHVMVQTKVSTSVGCTTATWPTI